VDYRKDLSEEVLKELSDLGSKAFFYECDLSELENIEKVIITNEKLYKEIIKDFKKIDILINNAGIVNGKSHHLTSIE
jgi:NAD(P)-dependent dehydrogenase (short-subunit alcohol dehydrogenase family)